MGAIVQSLQSSCFRTQQAHRGSLANPDHVAQILTFLFLARSYLTAHSLVYTQKQEDEKRRDERNQSFGGPSPFLARMDSCVVSNPLSRLEICHPGWYPGSIIIAQNPLYGSKSELLDGIRNPRFDID